MTRVVFCVLGAAALAGSLAAQCVVAPPVNPPPDPPVTQPPPDPGPPAPQPTTPNPSTPTPTGPSTGGPPRPIDGPSSPAGGNPATPRTGGGPRSPAGSLPSLPRTGGTPGRPNTPRGVPLGEDPTRWRGWWQNNRDVFLTPRRSIRDRERLGPDTRNDDFFAGAGRTTEIDREDAAPRRVDLEDAVVPQLFATLDSSTDSPTIRACLLALARIGREAGGHSLRASIRRHLRAADRNVRDTALLALGVAGRAETTFDLVDVATDSHAGRQLLGRRDVDVRSRSIAAYALGLAADHCARSELKQLVFTTLDELLVGDRGADRDVRIAAVHGLSLLEPDATTARGKLTLDRAIAVLKGYYERETGPAEEAARAHVPPAIARLLTDRDATDPQRSYWVHRFTQDLEGSRGRRPVNAMAQSLALALGRLALPRDDDRSPEAATSIALTDYAKRGTDHQARGFALLALGRIGGERNRDALLRVLSRGNKSTERPWAAIALGLLQRDRTAAADERSEARTARKPDVVDRALLAAFRSARNHDLIGATAIALGLAGTRAARDALSPALRRYRKQEPLAVDLCDAVALTGDDQCIPELAATLEESVRRPAVMRAAATALAILGDVETTSKLVETLSRTGSARRATPSTQRVLATARALDVAGPSSALRPLSSSLEADGRTAIGRAAIAAALGGIGDKAELPWHARLAAGTNYRAASVTLSNGVDGLLDVR